MEAPARLETGVLETRTTGTEKGNLEIMRAWIDTEFDGYEGRLISIAIVAEDGREWYAVINGPPPKDKWVAENVMPVLGNGRPMSPLMASASLGLWLSKYRSLHIIADWPDDIAYFSRALITVPGEMVAVPKLTFELDRDLPCTADWSKIPHNALEDARALRDWALR